ncbi:Alpha-glucosidase [Bacteroides ovatus]|uniref:glycoside hydrolase family 97 protein n=1 Tax=Bacteroides TaxID=816 RepID=UPI000E822EFD|nr:MULTISPECIES: glycoside hydrolase family 97 protein [Bacteroides]MCS3176630.1 glycoside hydrolase family 97 protein [Candidatus Bacteroides intestinigallinarum]MCS3201030.1 glycoside hydrolase family 97 protein [Candidatus Bacteroides intestinigallinarum]RGN66312.1 glycoside hydrolase family 97 protein [Bacteroides sp. OM05-10AA]RGQ68710.1 glycoside hydrolase family 97 protein [Bacteroides sp. AF27-33]CAG9901909.1 Alpha-glucosidase [Bacteroides ovatus]
MRKYLLLSMFLCLVSLLHARNKFELVSPNGEIKVSFNLSDKIYYSIDYNGDVLLKDNYLQLTLKNQVLGQNPKLRRQKRTSIDEHLTPVVPLKYSKVNNRYNQLLLTFKDYSVEFRAFDDGVAYRFITSRKGDVEVMGEEFAINFPSDYLLHLQQPGGFHTAYEEPYTHVQSNAWKPEERIAVLPVLIDTQKDYKILISESDLADYPCMFLKGTGTNGAISVFPKAPFAFAENSDRSVKITQEADYIAKTKGTRNYPWRYFVISKNDKQLIENIMTYRLAEKNQLQDVSWIKPGQVSWEWWNDASPYGPDVNFVSGYNLETYKYYIDFASKFGIPYIIMDEGWAKSTRDPYTPNPKVNLHELIRYGKEKNVGIVLWLTWLTVENNFDLFKTFNEWGVKGLKIDFMDRSDQWMVNYYERVAREAAKHNLFVDFHGSFKPAGLEYKYPNVLSYEGVRGMEQMGGCYPDNSLYLPFMRNAVGPMDYTPGAMISMQPNVYRSERPNSASIGTRAYQLALFVVFESGLQMLADNPTLYYRNEDCTRFITQVPVTWDETVALEAKAGEYVIVAKRKGDKWFIGGITNNGEKEREFTINLDFLNKDRSYRMTSFEDGINAGRQAMDYRCKSSQVKAGEQLTVKMVRNGGFAAVIE